MRTEITLLETRLETKGKRITRISLAECMAAALEAENMDVESIAEAEKDAGLTATIETIHEVLSVDQPLDQLIIERMPKDQAPIRDIVFISRTGALFPIYRPKIF